MQKLFLLTALAVCSLVVAAPIDQQQPTTTAKLQTDRLLQRPSPINPDVLSDPKPAEKITKITDEKEIAKIKREAGQVDQTQQQQQQQPILLTKTPVVQVKQTPQQQTPQQQTPQQQTPQQQQPILLTKTPVVQVKQTPEQQQQQVQRGKREEKSNEKKPNPPAAKPADKNEQKSRSKRDNATPIIYHNNEPAKPQTHEYVKPQTLPALLPASTESNVHKRDIPVPLTAKHAHAETTSEEQKQKAAAATQDTVKRHSIEDPNSKEDDSSERSIKQNQHKPIVDEIQVEDLNTHTHTPHKREGQKQEQQHNQSPAVEPTNSSTHPVVRPHPVPVAELFNRPKEQ